jgi:hypothetical protein
VKQLAGTEPERRSVTQTEVLPSCTACALKSQKFT